MLCFFQKCNFLVNKILHFTVNQKEGKQEKKYVNLKEKPEDQFICHLQIAVLPNQ